MTVLSAAQVAVLVRTAGIPADDRVPLIATLIATTGLRSDANLAAPDGGRLYGLFAIRGDTALDVRKLLRDPTYGATAARRLHDQRGLQAWPAYVSGAWRTHESQARQAVAQAAAATGSVALPGLDPAAETDPDTITTLPTYGGLGPRPSAELTVGEPTPSAQPAPGGLGPVRILGADLEGDIGSAVIGEPKWSAAVDTAPHLTLTVVDQGYALYNRGLWAVGSRVRWSNLDLRIDTVTTSPGTHGSGQAELTCLDDIVYALMQLRGPRSAAGISVASWLAQELALCGLDPARYLLAEGGPTQPEIIRDVPDQEGSAGSGQDASAWSTAIRLAKEQGKRVFVSGRRLVYGSAAFAMQWCAEGELRIGWDNTPEGERWFTIPDTTRTSVANRQNILQVVGVVNHNRAPFFRPGVPVRVAATPGCPDGLMMLAEIEHPLVESSAGATITLVQPVDPPAQPPSTTTAAALNGGSSSAAAPAGGGYDSQASQIVALALQQTGKQYVFGAEASPSDPNPRRFDCSELVEWACARAGVSPRMPDGSAAQRSHCLRSGTIVTVATAINTKGALLFWGNPTSHVAISLGNGHTVEAMNPSAGVRQGNANGRGWSAAARIPGVRY